VIARSEKKITIKNSSNWFGVDFQMIEFLSHCHGLMPMCVYIFFLQHCCELMEYQMCISLYNVKEAMSMICNGHLTITLSFHQNDNYGVDKHVSLNHHIKILQFEVRAIIQSLLVGERVGEARFMF
jgi:hypothetical protein